METAEQAALSESERDSAHHHHQSQSQMSHRLYETRHQNDYMSDDIRDMPPKPMRRFEKLVVNLTHSSVLVPAAVSLSGKKNLLPSHFCYTICISYLDKLRIYSAHFIYIIFFARYPTNQTLLFSHR